MPGARSDPTRADKEPHPSPIDVHVGTRIRLRRTIMGMSQERLGEALGLTFQQVQKYERGINRVGASRLYDLSRVLDVPISFFFDDMATPGAEGLYAPPPTTVGARRSHGFADRQDSFGGPPAAPADPMVRPEAQELVRAYFRITDPAVRKRVFDLIKSLTSE